MEKDRDLETAYIMPAYNAEATIAESIKSIYTSDSTAHVIVVDDASSDSTWSVVENLKNDYGLTAIRLDKNQGPGIARNKGLEKVKNAKYICFVDADVITNANAINACKAVLDKTAEVLVGTKETKSGMVQDAYPELPTLNSKLKRFLGLKPRPKDIPHYLISAFIFTTPSELRFDEHYSYAPEDADFCMQAYEKGWKIIYLDDVSVEHKTRQLWKRKPRFLFRHITGLICYFWKWKYLFSPKVKDI